MLLHDLRTQFNQTIPVCEGFFKLMQQTFGFYADLSNHFIANLGTRLEQGRLNEFLSGELKVKLMEPAFCQGLEERKKQILAETIKLEQFIASGHLQLDYLNDLEALKGVSNNLYDLLTRHWEIYKYEKQAISPNHLVGLMQEIDRIAIGWDSYLEKYLAVGKLLRETGHFPEKKGFAPVKVYFHLLEGSPFDLEVSNQLNRFLFNAYEFVLLSHGLKADHSRPEILNQESLNPVSLLLWIPQDLAASFAKLLSYLSIEVIKRETLVKYVMEVVAAGSGKEVPKTVTLSYQKKLAKLLETLPAGSYFTIHEEEMADSVAMLTQLVHELDRFSIQYKDLLAATSKRINHLRPQENKTPAKAPGPSTGANPKGESQGEVKINVDQKEHHGFLTS